ncbi:FAD-dependent oxidoreductase [Streptomyces sp. NPDC058735]|uniref:FAD-dependent oxidoreductase n=1 Tax=unclassified Streptomyces TaxID=2593676 RepID=UPI003699D4D9
MYDGDVVVIGGGYAGVRLAMRLDGTARVTLVDRKEVFFHRVACLRAGIRPERRNTPSIPYDRLPAHGRVTTGKAVRIDTTERQVVPRHRRAAAVRRVVITTGADCPEPARSTGTTEEAATSFAERQREVAAAGHVLVVGGGPGGVELAAVIRLARPGARVTLAHSGPAPLPSAGSTRPGLKALAWLESHDVRT